MKIFLLGDSFTDNLFEYYSQLILNSKSVGTTPRDWFNENEIVKYLTKLQSINAPKPLWFDDWLKEWGYEVYNFGKEGCTIEHVIYQFANLKNHKFNLGDRIIINWTHPSRFNWIKDDLSCRFVHLNQTGFSTELFNFQSVNRSMSLFNGGYLNKNLLPFMEYIVELHSKYKPIVWAPFPDVEKNIQKQEWYFNVNFLTSKLKNFTITHETSNVINDGHFGQYGNYYMAVLFDEIIKSNIGPYYNNDSKIIFDKTLDRIKFEKKEFITIFDASAKSLSDAAAKAAASAASGAVTTFKLI